MNYSDKDSIAINGQKNTNSAIERFELSDVSFLSSDDINRIIQDINSYAVDNGIDIKDNKDIKNNDALMQIVMNAWAQ